MAYNIGPKIGIDGEAEFRSSLQNINQQLKTLGSEMKAVTSSFTDGDKSEEVLAAQTDVLNRQIDAQQKKLTELQKGLDAAAEKYGENDTRTLQWAQAVNNATADLNKLRSQLSRTEQGMDDMADATEDAGTAADRAGGKFGTFQAAMGSLISSGIQAALSAVGNLVGALVNLDETTEEYRQAQGRLNTAFEVAGFGAETAQAAYQAFYGILGDTDTATEASQLLAQLADSEEDVSKWAEIAAGVSGTFGDSLPVESLIEAANETAKVGEVTGTLADALNWVGISEDNFNTQLAACSTESERNQLIMETLAGQYDAASEAFYRNNEALVASRNAQAQMDASLATLGESISNIKTRLASELTPALPGVITAFHSVLTGESGAGAALAGAITKLLNSVITLLPQAISAGAQVAGSLVMGIVQSAPAIVSAGADLIQQMVDGLLSALPALVESAPEVIAGFLGALAQHRDSVLGQGVEMLSDLVNGILETIPDMVARLPEIVDAFVTFLAGSHGTILEAGVEILTNLIKGIIDTIPELAAELPGVIAAFTQTMAKNTPKIIQSGVDLLQSLIEGIISSIPSLVATLPQIIAAIVEGIGALMSGIVDIGENIVEGLWQGISNMASWIRSKVSGFVGGIVDDVKGILGIHSPSKVFSEMGENMALGLGNGFGDEMRAVQQRINRSMADLTAPNVSGTYDLNPQAAPEYGPTYGFAGADAIAAAVRTALQGSAVYLNGRRVGDLITQQQNASAVARGQSQVYL